MSPQLPEHLSITELQQFHDALDKAKQLDRDPIRNAYLAKMMQNLERDGRTGKDQL